MTTAPTKITPIAFAFVLAAATTILAAPEPALRVGAASVALAARDDMVIAGGIAPGRARGQEGELRVSATVVEDGARARVAIVACDILMMRRDFFDAAGKRIERDLGIPFAHVLMNATHTHHAPATVSIHDYERDEAFCAAVRDAIVAATKRAVERLEKPGSECRFLFRLGEESSVGQNSRLLLDDGTIYWIGRRDKIVRPTGPFDPELPVLAFERLAGGFESVIFNHSTHLIGTNRAGVRSPSFYGLAAQELEASRGGTFTFIAGAYGSTHNLTLSCPEMVLRIRRAVERGLGRLLPRRVDAVRALRREVTYKVRRFDEAAEEKAVSSYCKLEPSRGGETHAKVFRAMRAKLERLQGEERTTWIQALRIGDVALVGIPGECFTSLGVEIKRRSPFRYTYIAGTANDYVGYIPDDEAYDLGGYQVWTGFHSFVERGTGEAFVDVAVEMLEKLHDETAN